jgi:predicted DNA-binding protein (UPF0278 family)
VFASTWESMLYNVGGEYELLNDIKITNTKDNSFLNYKKGTRFYLETHMPLPYIRVQLYEFVAVNCLVSDFKSDMNLFTTYETPRKVEIGLEASELCLFGVFVENKDLSTGNFFKEVN